MEKIISIKFNYLIHFLSKNQNILLFNLKNNFYEKKK